MLLLLQGFDNNIWTYNINRKKIYDKTGFNELPTYLKERVPVFKYDLFNIDDYEESDFEKLTRLTAMMLKAFKYAFEEDIKKEIIRLDGKGAVTMSILQKREEKGIQEVAKNLLKEGAELSLVVKATGLSKSEVEKLQEQLNN